MVSRYIGCLPTGQRYMFMNYVAIAIVRTNMAPTSLHMYKKIKESMLKKRTVCIILVVLAVLLLYSVYIQKLIIVARIWRESSMSCSSFLQWAQMIQRQDYIHIKDHTQGIVDTPKEPHFILGNHIGSHYSMGTFITISDLIKSPARIVCYVSYQDLLLINSTIHMILDNEIKIDVKLSHSEKEQCMVDGIRKAFAAGNNVVMFLDAHVARSPMRTLNKVVLGHFPEYKKQLVHTFEPTCTNEFGYRRYPATYDLKEILRYRNEIVSRQHVNKLSLHHTSTQYVHGDDVCRNAYEK
jgi:hypothetical protein